MKNDISKAVGSAMLNERKRKNISRVDMAHRPGVSDVAVFYREPGRNSISIDNLKEYCDVLDISVIDLLKKIPQFNNQPLLR